MGRRGEHSKEELRSMAVSAAEARVAASGLSGLTVRKVAEDIGYTAGSLYTIFHNQDELILELNGRTVEALAEALTEALAETLNSAIPPSGVATGESRDQLLAMAQAYLDFAVANPHRWRLAFEHHLPDVEILPAKFQQKIDAIYDLLAGVLQCIVPINYVRLAAVTLWSQVHGLCTLTLNHKLEFGGIDGDSQSANQVLVFAIDNYLEGLRTDSDLSKQPDMQNFWRRIE